MRKDDGVYIDNLLVMGYSLGYPLNWTTRRYGRSKTFTWVSFYDRKWIQLGDPWPTAHPDPEEIKKSHSMPNLDEHQQRFVKLHDSFSYRHSGVLADFAAMSAISLANALQVKNARWEAREKQYLEIAKKYPKDDLAIFAQMLACVVDSLQLGIHDTLGEIYMAEEMKSRWDRDVAFTPKEVGKMMAQMSIGENPKVPEKGYWTICEPAAGTGGLIISHAAALKEAGINYQQAMHVTAVEIRGMLAHMAYVQFALLHIPAVVIHGNTLSLEEWSRWETPAHTLGFWDARLHHDRPIETVARRDAPVQKGQSSFDFNLRGETDGKEKKRRKTRAA